MSSNMLQKCKNCEASIEGRKSFCNSSCAAKYNNRLYPKRTNGRDKPKCKNCETPLKAYDRTYCNTKCQAGYYYKTVTLPSILEGTSKNIRAIKEYLCETEGACCTSCGTGIEWKGKPLTLHLDHIDGNSDNNSLQNLRLLCPNCHSQTDTFGHKGQGIRYKKRTKRNEYLRAYSKQ